MAMIVLLLSMALLRLEQVRITHANWPKLVHAGILAGILADIALVLFMEGARRLLCSITPRIGKLLSTSLVIALWSLLAANVCYFAFFQSELYLWVANSYSENAWSVRSVAIRLLERPWIVGSFALMITFVVKIWRTPLGAAPKHKLRQACTGILLIALALVARQLPNWRSLRQPQISESIFANNIAWRWVYSIKKHQWNARLPIENYQKILPDAPKILEQYSKKNLVQENRLELSRALHERFGFQPNQKLNFIILFLESGRAYELLSPKTGPSIYPEFRKVLSQHGILFNQTYSMASITVQGQFSTLCSRMDRMDAAPTYSRQPYAQVDCLPAVLKENGYNTYWMNPYHRFFAGKYVFESNHGTETFFDREFFVPRNEEEKTESKLWGVSDETFLSEAFEKLEEIHEQGKPFFVHLLTTGTHAPWQTLRKFPLSEEMRKWSEGSSDYAGYLSTASALDHSLGTFFEQFFKSPLSNDTVVVVMGDHGTGVTPPNANLTKLQTNLLWPRIILGVITKKMQKPETVTHLVHQMDVAPLLAATEGIPQPSSWMGREPLISNQGTLWVKRNGNRFFYRTPDRLCGKLSGADPLQCWQFSRREDPLFESSPRLIPEKETQTHWFKAVVDANEAILELAGGNLSGAAQNM